MAATAENIALNLQDKTEIESHHIRIILCMHKCTFMRWNEGSSVENRLE